MKKRIVSLFLSLVLIGSLFATARPVKTYAISEGTVKIAAKGLIEKGISTIPGGAFITPLLSPVLGEVLGIKGNGAILSQLGMINEKLDEIKETLDEINGKLDAMQTELRDIQQNIKDLSNKLDQSTQILLSEMFESRFGITLDSFNTKLTSVAYITERMYRDMALLYENDLNNIERAPALYTSDLYKTLTIAESIETFNSNATDDYVNMVMTLSKYLDGSQITLGNARNLYETVYLASCNNSVLGGEAAMRIVNYLNQVSGTLSSAYKMLIIVAKCKVYVAEHYDEVLAASNPNSENYDKYVAALVEYGLKSNYKDIASLQNWKNLVSDGDASLWTRHNQYFGETDSLSSKYNEMVASHWFDYIRDCKLVNNDIQVTFFTLDTCIYPYNSSLEVTEGTANAVYANNSLNAYLDSALSGDEVQKLVEHIIQNANGVYVDLSSGNTKSTTEKSFLDILRDYGFEIGTPVHDCETTSYKKGTGPDLFVYKSTVTVTDGKTADFRVSGYDGNVKNGYYLSGGSLYSPLPQYEDYQYYGYDSVRSANCFENMCTFYFFRPAHVEINNELDFESFILSVGAGNTYYNTEINLNCDLDLSDCTYSALWAGLTEESSQKGFMGTFNGNGHTIKNLNDTGDAYGAGLFRTIGSGATICNLTFENVNINAASTSNAGTLAAKIVKNITSKPIVIDNVYVKSGTLSGKKNVGGLVGYTNGVYLIKNCTNNAFISASTTDRAVRTGGIVAYVNNGGLIENCRNTGEMSSCIGAGIVGHVEGGTLTVNGCSNSGKIKNVSVGAGIIGWAYFEPTIKITNCENSAVISAGAAGGIIAYNYSRVKAYVTDNRNTGNINTENKEKAGDSAGIIGYNLSYDIDLSRNYNSGDVYGTYAAGIIADSLNGSLTLDDCVNEGDITSNKVGYASGIAAYVYNNSYERVVNHSAKNCVNKGNVNAKYYGSGIFGKVNKAKTIDLSYCKNYGAITSSNDVDQITAVKEKSCTYNLTGCVYGGTTAVASIFGQGSLLLILVCAIILTCATVCTVVIVKKNKNLGKTK